MLDRPSFFIPIPTCGNISIVMLDRPSFFFLISDTATKCGGCRTPSTAGGKAKMARVLVIPVYKGLRRQTSNASGAFGIASEVPTVEVMQMDGWTKTGRNAEKTRHRQKTHWSGTRAGQRTLGRP